MARPPGAKRSRTTAAPSRRPTPRLIALGAAVFVVAAIAAGVWWRRDSAFALPATQDENVLLVTIDTLRASALSSYGGPAATPNLDRLAAHGARFTFAHAATVLTLPSHATILTGLYPYQHGIRDNIGYRLRPDASTMATRLRSLGFATGAFVGAFVLEKRFGLNLGFDVYDDQIPEVGSTANFNETERRADAVVKVADAWIDRTPGKWFGWVHVYDSHAPYRPPDEWRARYPQEPYYGTVAWTDYALGPLFDRLRALARPTLVIVTGDHGESLGEHGEATHGVFTYEATLRIPLIIAMVAPGAAREPRGRVIDSAVRHIDLLPTVLDAVGARPDPSLPGASLRDVILHSGGPDRQTYFEAMMTNLARGWAPLRGVLVGHEKYIDLPIPELYDLASDPTEAHNLAASSPDRVGALANVLRGINVAPPNRPTDTRMAVKDALRSLGYLSTTAKPRAQYTAADDPKRLIDLDRRMHEAVSAYEAGKLDDAVTILHQVIAERPDNAEAVLDLAVAYWQAGRDDDAIDVLQEAMKRGVTQSDVRTKLGLCLGLAGRGTQAIPLLENTAGDDPDALDALGLAYTQTGRLADARRTYQHLLAIDPTSGLAYENLASVDLAAKQLPAAEVDLRHALDLDPTLTGARTDLGHVLADTGRLPEAIDAWRQAAQNDSEAYAALYNLTMVLAHAGRGEEARAYGERFVRTAPPTTYAAEIAEVRRLLGGTRE
jgi:arylsulfatase A-like enzyme/predicted negative regulator of RcsB-dependent stress response